MITVHEKVLPMQYLGSKSRISNWIVKTVIKEFPDQNNLIDLFGGTGNVSIAAINHGLQPYLNDIQPYSAALLNSLIVEKRTGLKKLIADLSDKSFKNRLLEAGRHKFGSLLNEEKQHFDNFDKQDYDWQSYKHFSDSTKTITSRADIIKLRKNNTWNLFSCYYSNKYFGVSQCLEIDLLRQYCDELPNNLRTHLFAACISALSINVSSTTHLAQFLKPTSKSNTLALIKKRKRSIIQNVIKNLTALSETSANRKSLVTNLDYTEALNFFQEKLESFVIYADPPYFKEHYSRYYHVLDTFLLYDYPFISTNAQTKNVTAGLYRDNRIVSDFGLKGKVGKAFSLLFQKAYDSRNPLVISYADSSIMSKEKIKIIAANNNFTVKTYQHKLIHSGQGQKRHNSVTEYLFVCKPIL